MKPRPPARTARKRAPPFSSTSDETHDSCMRSCPNTSCSTDGAARSESRMPHSRNRVPKGHRASEGKRDRHAARAAARRADRRHHCGGDLGLQRYRSQHRAADHRAGFRYRVRSVGLGRHFLSDRRRGLPPADCGAVGNRRAAAYLCRRPCDHHAGLGRLHVRAGPAAADRRARGAGHRREAVSSPFSRD